MKTFALLLPLVALAAGDLDIGLLGEKVPDHLVAGTCPVVDEKALWAAQKPNHPKYAGRWFEVALSKNDFQLVKQCTMSDLTYNNVGFDHKTTGLDQHGNQIQRTGVTYEFTTGPNRETPHLSIQYEQPSFPAPYVVLDTDYINYSCIYSCMDFNGNFVTDFMFVWSRTPNMNAQYLDKCLVVFKKHGLDVSRLEKVTQGSECDSIEDRSSVKDNLPNYLVPGQCPVVDEKALWAEQKPNHPKYAGRWFEVARSENVFQLVKRCTKSDLTYKNEVFEHITTGLDQTGNPIRREGVTYEFTTGPNKESPHLSIQFEQPSFAAPYVLLDTDYVNYSCIYSCIDFNKKFVSDFMFIWSRTPTMNAKYMDKCLAAFKKHGLDVSRLEKIIHGSDCNSKEEL